MSAGGRSEGASPLASSDRELCADCGHRLTLIRFRYGDVEVCERCEFAMEAEGYIG